MCITKRDLNILMLLMLPAFRLSIFPLINSLHKSWISLLVSLANLSNRLLDLFLTSSPSSYWDLQHCPLGISDHSVISIRQEPPIHTIFSMVIGIHSVTFFETPLGLRIAPLWFLSWIKDSFLEIPGETSNFSMVHNSMFCCYIPQESLFPAIPVWQFPS